MPSVLVTAFKNLLKNRIKVIISPMMKQLRLLMHVNINQALQRFYLMQILVNVLVSFGTGEMFPIKIQLITDYLRILLFCFQMEQIS